MRRPRPSPSVCPASHAGLARRARERPSRRAVRRADRHALISTTGTCCAPAWTRRPTPTSPGGTSSIPTAPWRAPSWIAPSPALVGRKKTLHAAGRDDTARAAVCAPPHAPVCARPAHPAGVISRAALATAAIIASLHLRGMGPTIALPGAADASAFEADVRDVLAPTVRPGQIVLLDTARIHLRPRIAQMIAAHGCERWLLPGASPDDAPIEDAFARLNHQWRQAEARTPDALRDAVGRSLPSISAQDAHGFVRTCGFQTETNQVQCF